MITGKLLAILLLLTFCLHAQQPPLSINKFGLAVINDVTVYKNLVSADSNNIFLDLRTLIPDARFDVKYATPNNLVKKAVYPAPDVFLRKPAAIALQQAQEILKKSGYGLLFFDGYRPYSVTVLFYETIRDTTYVADPRKGSRHNRGMAIDLSLYNLATGVELPMPSAYDETSERAFHEYSGADSIAIANRNTLRKVMEDVGFEIYKWEWWHYDFKGWKDAAIYDILHSKIKEANMTLAKTELP